MRVSTEVQNLNRQNKELKDYCEKMNFDLVRSFEEVVSGGKKNEERLVLTEMVQFIKENEIDKVLCWEMSRLGRNTIEVLRTIEILNENKISLYIKNFNLETLNENGEVNPLSNLMIQILTSIGEMERTQIRQRIKSGYDNYRSNGGKVGRKEGFRKTDEELLEQYKDVVKELNRGTSVRRVMKLTDRSSGTIMKVKRIITNELK